MGSHLTWRNDPAVALTAGYTLLIGGVALVLANGALGPFIGNDYSLYHAQVVMWTNAHPIVPGLANLHGRFGFNNAVFLYVALTNTTPLGAIGSHAAGGLLIMNLLLLSIYSVRRLLGGDTHPDVLFGVLTLPVASYLAATFHLRTPTNDLPPIVLGMMAGVLLWRLLARRGTAFSVLAIIMMTGAGAVSKVSYAGLGGAAALLACGLYWWQVRRFPVRLAVWAGAFGVMIVGVWLLRGVILSGYLLYPTTTFSFDVDWRVSCAAAIEEARIIYIFARSALSPEGEFITEGWGWLGQWSLWILKQQFIVTLPLALFVVFFFSWLVQSRRRPRNLLFMLVPVAGLTFWFFAAPDPRFAVSSFWLLAIGAIMLVLLDLAPRSPRAVSVITLVLALALAIPQWWAFEFFLPGERNGFHPPQHVELVEMETDSGLVVNMPATRLSDDPFADDRCFASPLPCTPHFNEALRLRVPGAMGSGFVDDAAVTCP